MKFQIHRFPEVASTNTVACEYAAKSAPEGTVITAGYQTSGRGKPGKRWISPPGKNLLFSVLIRPPVSVPKIPAVTQIACRSAAEVLKKNYAINSTFKKPNDILVEGKKICGVLVEAISKAGCVESAVIGIGLNVNASSSELPETATSMREIKGKEFHLDEILHNLLAQLSQDLAAFYDHSV